jgi:hypothetical protein
MLDALLHSVVRMFEAVGDSALLFRGVCHSPVQRSRCLCSSLVSFLVMATS